MIYRMVPVTITLNDRPLTGILAARHYPNLFKKIQDRHVVITDH